MKIPDAQRAERHLSWARQALQDGNPRRAGQHLARALALRPDWADARLLAAQAHLQAGYPDRALADLDACDQYHPQARLSPRVAFLRAAALASGAHDDAAQRLLGVLVRDFPDDTRAHRLLAGLHLKHRRWEHAAGNLRAVVRLEPSDTAARRTLAQVLSDRHPEEAAGLLEADPDAEDRPMKRRLAELYHRAGRDLEAEDVYRELLRDHADDAETLAPAGALAATLGDDALALRRLGRAVASTTAQRKAALALLARAHMQAGRFAPAARCWFRLAREGGAPMDAWAGVMVCALAGRRLRLARRALEAMPQDWPGVLRREAIARQWADAALGRKLRRIQAGAAEYLPREHSPLTELLRQATATLAQHARGFPRRADTHYHLAVCHAALGEVSSARWSARQALEVNPRYAAAGQLAESLAESGRQAA